MKIDPKAVRACLKSFDFATLFREHLGWEKHKAKLEVTAGQDTVSLSAVAQKRGFVAYVCHSIPDRQTRLTIDHQVTKSAREHFVIYCDPAQREQVWHWVRREPGKPAASRDHRFQVTQPGDHLIQRLENIAVSLQEEEVFTLVDVNAAARAAFDVDRVTKKFYDEFKAEHAAFLKLVKGIPSVADLQWYTSLMLNRLMFVYFIQKKGFLDGDVDYLRNRLQMVREARGKNQFQSFYQYFLVRLFHDGLGQLPEERKLDPPMEKILGKVPYLNGGFFEVHELEQRNANIDIPDKAFERLFAFFDRWSWHLDERPLRADNEINPDVVGYIFEKYINQKQMGAYYTKEDITEYISKNTVIPYLFTAAEKRCPIAFQPGSFIWRLLQEDPDRYIYAAVRHGVVDEHGAIIPLPKAIAAGISDVSKRGGWNRPAADVFALPTETWREHVARRLRCLELRERLAAGNIHSVEELITLNLDIWQFARDAIVQSEGPELLRAFWDAIEHLTILDPTCGSGAFLFAALRILESLYADCLAGMERFAEHDTASTGDPARFTDFRRVLAQIARHPNERYFILKSIIVNNLFGVDIMEEAVEICKLRLFLKLVAQVEDVSQIEPLPDIDFNIRAGNTLVGYATQNDARRAFTENAGGQGKLMLGDLEDAYTRFEEDAESVERAFRQFRLQQTMHGGKVTAEDKRELRRRLAKLADQLDRYLAGEYGVKPTQKKAYEDWRASHHPFHWFIEFYGIMHVGGFDVIIGNPPYIEYREVQNIYSVKGYTTEACGNLYAFCWERSISLSNREGQLGKIIPVASVSTDAYAALRSVWLSNGNLVVSNFNDRPGKLFEGLEHIRLAIVLLRRSESPTGSVHITTYTKWLTEARGTVFEALRFTNVRNSVRRGCLPKLGSGIEESVLGKVFASGKTLSHFAVPDGRHRLFYTRKLSSFVQILDFIPRITDARGREREPSELKDVRFGTSDQRNTFLCALNSTLFYWLLTVWSDCRNLNKREVFGLPLDFASLDARSRTTLNRLGSELMKDFRKHSRVVEMTYGDWGAMSIQCVYPKWSKPIIDEIDMVLARHYGFTDEELDFIINYDIKYRVGAEEESHE